MISELKYLQMRSSENSSDSSVKRIGSSSFNGQAKSSTK
ncbi:hypothetical protein TNIN_265771, partial [Trichonephila inaurata madagascariensis]